MEDSLTPPAGRRPASPREWSPWLAPAALVGGLVVAAVGGLVVDIPAALFGVNVTAETLPPGLAIADTIVQDLGFVLVAVFFAQLGGKAVSAAMFGLRRTNLRRALGLALGLAVLFLLLSIVWNAIFQPEEEKLLEQLGTNEGPALLLLSALLTCVIAPFCEEFLFRGFIFTALRNWKGLWPAAILTGLLFGGIHVGSAPALDLVPLAGLGFGLCLLYRATGSLYPGIAAHSLNNALAFGLLERWNWQIPILMIASLLVLSLLALALERAGVTDRAGPAPAGI